MENTHQEDLLARIVRVPGVCGGAPVVRGMRWPVEVVLGMLASGDPWDFLLAEFPELEEADFRACILYAARLASFRSVDLPKAA